MRGEEIEEGCEELEEGCDKTKVQYEGEKCGVTL